MSLIKLARKFKWLLTFHTTHHLYLLALPPLFPLLRETVVPSYTMLGILRGVFAASGFLMILSGQLSDRIGERKVILMEFLLIPVFLVLSAFSPSYIFLLIFVAGFGLSKILYHPAGLSFLSKSTHRVSRGEGIGLHESVGSIGGGIAFIALGFLGEWFGWRHALIILGALALVLSVSNLLLGSELGEVSTEDTVDSDNEEKSQTDGIGNVLGIKSGSLPSFYLQVGSTIIIGVGFGAFVTFLASFLKQTYGFSTGLAGLLVGISYFLGFFGNLFGGKISDKIGEVLSYTIFMGLTVLPVTTLVILDLPFFLLIPSLALCFLLRSLGNPADKSLLAELSSTSGRGRGYGSLFTSYTTGTFVSGPLFGFLIDSLGMRSAFLFIPILFIVGAAVRYQVKRYS